MSLEAQSAKVQTQAKARNWLVYIVGAICLLYLAFFFLYRLNVFPSPGWEEGSYMKAAKNFALNGVYADFSSEGNRYTGAVQAGGPTLILPVAAAFKLLGVGVLQARYVEVSYGVSMLAMLYLVCANLRDARLAMVTIALVVFNPLLDLVVRTREIAGEVPGLFFLFAALWLWSRPDRRSLLGLCGAGILFGLASISKSQDAIFVLPGLFLTWMLDLFWYKRRGWLHFVIPGIIAGIIYVGWQYYVLFLLGAGSRNVAADIASLRTSTNSALFVLNPSINYHNLLHLLDPSGYLGLFIPALVYGFVLSLRRDAAGQRWSTVYVMLVGSILMYVFSLGLLRYSVPTFTLIIPFIAMLFYSLTNGFTFQLDRLRNVLRGDELTQPALMTILVAGLAVFLIILPAWNQAKSITRDTDDSPYQLGQYLDQTVPKTTLIETYEEELPAISDHRYHFPPHSVMVNAVLEVHYDVPAPGYNFRDYVDPEFVIVGAAAVKDHVYSPDELKEYDLVQTFGTYQVYRRRADL